MIKQMRFEDVVKKLSDEGKFHAFVSNNFRQITGGAIIKGFTIEPTHIDYYDEYMRTYRYCWIVVPDEYVPDEYVPYENNEFSGVKCGDVLKQGNSEGLVTATELEENGIYLTQVHSWWHKNEELFKKFTTADGTPIGKLKTNNNNQVDMVYVEGGTFQMGSDSEEGNREKPIHSVTLSSFHIGKYEITQKQWKAVMGSNPSKFKGDNLPVESISWYQAVEFCNKLSQKEGLTPAYTINGRNVTCNWKAIGYRLPTEAEWEYAARGGNRSKGFIYAGSDNLVDVAWYENNSGRKTHEVGIKKANELGIYDMSGNVWEWCWDLYGSYSSDAKTNPSGPDSGSGFVLRGGGWDFRSEFCRSAYRFNDYPDYRDDNFGFRVARNF